MHPPQTLRIAAVTITLLLGINFVTLGQTPPPGENQPAPREGPRPPRDGAIRPGAGYLEQRNAEFQIFRVLNEEQRKSYRQTMEEQGGRMRELGEKMRDARKSLLDATLAEKFDDDAVRKKANEVGKVQAEMEFLRAKWLSQVEPKLSADQIEKLKNPPPMELPNRSGAGFGGGQGQPPGSGDRRRGPPPAGRDGEELFAPPPPPSPK